MRKGRMCHLWLSLLSMLIPFWFVACSTSQEEEGDPEVTEQEAGAQEEQGEQGEGNEVAEENGEQVNSNLENANLGQGDETAENGAEGAAEGGEATDEDLQSIIADTMNGQNAQGEAPMAEGEAAPTDGAQMADAGMQAAPANAPLNDAAAPANAPAPSNAAMSAPTNAAAPAAAGVSAGPALPELAAKMPYIVQRGDTLAKISQRIYGNMGRWKEIASLSGMNNPSKIYPGDVVYYQLTEESKAFATAYESVPRQEVSVQAGDTLATIAHRVLGNSADWKSIWRQNDHIDNPDKLEVGTTVYYVNPSSLTAAIKTVKSQYNQIAETIKDTTTNTNSFTFNSNVNNSFSANSMIHNLVNVASSLMA